MIQVLGVDPGAKGGLALISGTAIRDSMRMPVLEHRGKKVFDAKTVMKTFHKHRVGHVVLEQVSAMPKQGVSSSFQFGRMFGAVEAFAQLYGCPITYVTPSVWKQALGLNRSKQSSLDLARLTFGPSPLWQVKANDGIAEAALLAHWHLQKYIASGMFQKTEAAE